MFTWCVSPRQPGAARHRPRRAASFVLALELLEERQLLSGVPVLDSFPGARATLFLDFDGHFESRWGSFRNVRTPAFDVDGDPTTFGARETTLITEVWRRMAEFFSPFSINVTTRDPGSTGDGKGLRVVIGGSSSDWYGQPAGGVGYVGSFTDPYLSNTAYVFSKSLRSEAGSIVIAAAHEAGHAFGLEHQSTYDDAGHLIEEYNAGTDATAPIMGDGYYAQRALWWHGPNSEAVVQDDLAILSGADNGFGYREDGVGHSLESATKLGSGPSRRSGVIVKVNQSDVFSFVTDGGAVSFKLDVPQGGMLDARLELLDSKGKALATADPSDQLGATLQARGLAAGKYYLRVVSHGGYGDIGSYTVDATLPERPPHTSAGGRTQLANKLTHSQEYYTHLVTRQYEVYLKRKPDTAGLDSWVIRMQGGGSTDEDLEASFLASAEYVQNQGGTAAGWLRGLYRDLFDREPDSEGLQHWLGAVAKGFGFFDIAKGFTASQERETWRVTTYYATTLGRLPDKAGLEAWVDRFMHGQDNETVIGGFVGSDEYFGHHGPEAKDWLNAVYTLTLHRQPTTAEIDEAFRFFDQAE